MDGKSARRTWPIVYGRRRHPMPYPGVRLAWGLFLGLGLPFALMSILTVLARTGIYIDLLRPLWQPWPPELLKPFLGLAVFALTLAYLAYRVGLRSGVRSKPAVMSPPESGWTRNPSWTANPMRSGRPLPPPPPPDDFPADM